MNEKFFIKYKKRHAYQQELLEKYIFQNRTNKNI